MSTRARTLAAVAAASLLCTLTGVARADVVEQEEVIVGEEHVEPPAPTPAPAEETCCTIPPLEYFDRTADGITGWFAKPPRELVLSSGLSTAFQWDFNDPPNDK